MVDELTTLLDVAGVPGPYVLVGHSLAGFNVQLFAREDAGDTVVGVVLIDATPPGLIAVFDRFGIPIPPPDDLVENEEGFDYRVSATQIRDAGPFPPVPLVVLTHGEPGSYGPPLEEIWQELQVAQSLLSPEGRLIVARKSGHFIQNDQPRLVVFGHRAGRRPVPTQRCSRPRRQRSRLKGACSAEPRPLPGRSRAGPLGWRIPRALHTANVASGGSVRSAGAEPQDPSTSR